MIKSKNFPTSLPIAVMETLKELAKKERRSVSSLVLEGVELLMANRKQEGK